jgi:hypothetical protein
MPQFTNESADDWFRLQNEQMNTSLLLALFSYAGPLPREPVHLTQQVKIALGPSYRMQ